MKADRELRESLREPHEEARAHANWEAITRRRRRPSPTQRAPLFAALSLGAAVAVVAFFAWAREAPGPLVREDGTVALGVIEGASSRLDDGSQITVEDGGRLEILENTGDHVRFWLHDGAARFDIVPGGPRRWVIETGLVTVEVLGTAFRVEHGERDVNVAVERGTVLVRGPTAPGGMQRLRAGESISVPTGEPSIVTTAEPAIDALAVEAREELAAPVTRAPFVEPVPRARAGVRREGREGLEPSREVEPPVAATEPPEPAAEAPVVPSAARLRDADALRAQGRLDEAATLLAAIADDPTAGNQRALAAFTLARLEIDRRHHPVEAAAAFERAIELGLRAPLLEDARARRVEALSLSGDLAAARVAAETYLTHHPEGRWRTEVERWSAAR